MSYTECLHETRLDLADYRREMHSPLYRQYMSRRDRVEIREMLRRCMYFRALIKEDAK